MSTGCSQASQSFLCPLPYPSASLMISPLLASTQVWEWVGWGGLRAAMVVKVMNRVWQDPTTFGSPGLCPLRPQHPPLGKSLFHSMALDLPETRGLLQASWSRASGGGLATPLNARRELAASS